MRSNKSLLANIYKTLKSYKIFASQREFWNVLILMDANKTGISEKSDRSYYSEIINSEAKYKAELAVRIQRSLGKTAKHLCNTFMVQASKQSYQEMMQPILLNKLLDHLKEDESLATHLKVFRIDAAWLWKQMSQHIITKDYELYFEKMLSLVVHGKIQTDAASSKLTLNSEYSFATREQLEEFMAFTLKYGVSGYSSAVVLFNQVEYHQNTNPFFCYELGELYFYGKYSFEPNLERARFYYELAAEQNHPLAIWSLGQIIEQEISSIQRVRSAESALREAVHKYHKAKENDCFQAVNNLGKIYMRAIYYLAGLPNIYTDSAENHNATAYLAVGPNKQGGYYDQEFAQIIRGKDPARPEDLQQLEDAIIEQYFQPLIDQHDYFYACASILTIYQFRFNRSTCEQEKQNNYYRMIDYYRKQARLGEPWAANRYALILEEELQQNKSTTQPDWNEEKIEQEMIDFTQKAVFQYFTRKEDLWPVFNWSRFMLERKHIDAVRQQRAEEYLRKIMQIDLPFVSQADRNKRMKSTYQLLSSYYTRCNMTERLKALEAHYGFLLQS